MRLEPEEWVLRGKKGKITGENTFNGDHLGIEVNHGSTKGEKLLFGLFLRICDNWFNP